MIQYIDWGMIPYQEAWEIQKETFHDLIESKQNGKPYMNKVIFCQHPHVYTLGKSGKENNLLFNKDILANIGATYFHVDRGGDVTYHGPGQLVCYPILNLDDFNLGLKDYIDLLEEAVITLCGKYGVTAQRLKGATGVWVRQKNETVKKICAIGVRSSHYVTMHGFALNVTTDMKYYNYINPCGFIDKGVTSLKQELNENLSMEEIMVNLKSIFKSLKLI